MPPRERQVELDDDVVDQGGGAVVEFDDADHESPYDLDAERAHLETRYPVEDDDADTDEIARRNVQRSQQRRAAADDPDDAGDGQDEGEGADDDLDGYGQKVQKRIRKETGKRRHAERIAAAADQAARAAIQKAEDLERQLHSVVGSTLDESVERMTADLEAKQTALAEAIEKGDTARQVELTNDLIEIRSNLNLARLRRPTGQQQRQQQRRADDDDDAGDQRQQRQQRQPNQGGAAQPTAQTAAWLQDNGYWFQDPANAWAKDMAIEIDNELTREGFTSDAEHYAELNRRLIERDERMADFVDEPNDRGGQGRNGRRSRRQPADDGGRNGAPRRRMRSPVAAADGNGVSRKDGKTQVRLTSADIKTIEAWGLDPSDPKVIQTYARERVATAADFKNRGHG